MSQIPRAFRFGVVIAVTSLVCLSVAAPAVAQRSRSGAQSLLSTLRRSSVQDELKLSVEQRQKIDQAAQSGRPSTDSFKPFLEKMREAETEEERDKIRKEMQEALARQRSNSENNVRDLLTDEQSKRLDQIVLQQQGPAALLTDNVANGLNITDGQKDEIKSLIEQREEALKENGFRGGRDALNKLRADWDDKILAVLEDGQRTAWKAQLGEPFDASARSETASADGASGDSRSADGGSSPRSTAPGAAPGTVASFGGNQDEADSGAKPQKFSFNFRYAPWPLVLEMFADASDLSLDLFNTPPGTFNHFDKNEYSPTKALDVMNGYLLRQGYLMVKRDGFLIVYNYDNGVPPNLIPEVSVEDLEKMGTEQIVGDNELVTVQFNLEGVDVDQTAREVDAMLGPYGFESVTALTATNILMVTDIGSNLRRVNRLLANSKRSGLQFKQFQIEHIMAEEAESIVRAQFGLSPLVPNVSQSGSSPSRFDSRSRSTPPRTQQQNTETQVNADPRTNSLLVVATEKQLKLAEEILAAVDVSEDQFGNKLAARGANIPELRVYQLASSDPVEVAKTLDAIMPGVVVNEDGRYRRLHIKTTPANHDQIRLLIDQMDGIGTTDAVVVINLAKTDPISAAAMIRSLFLSEGSGAPAIEADTYGRRLIIRGTNDHVAQIKTLLAQIGEDGTVDTSSMQQTGPVRRFQLGGRNPEEFLRMIERVWSRSESNPLRVVIPTDQSPIRGQEVPSADRGDRARMRTGSTSREARFRYTTLQDQNQDGDARENGQEDEILDEFDELLGGDEQLEPSFGDEQGQADPNKPPIVVTYSGDTLIVTSDDEEALARLETMIDQLNQAMPVRTAWTVFYLRSADCNDAAAMLEQIFPASSVATTSTGDSGILGGLSSGLSSFGSSLMDMTGLSAVGTGPQTLRIIPEIRSNSLFVSGPDYLVREVDQMLRVLDSNELPESFRDLIPRPIDVKYADVDEIATIVRDVFKPYTEPQQAAGQSNPLAMLMGGGRSSSSRGGQAKQQVRMTVGVDRQTSQLIVACSESLHRQVAELVNSLDQSALAANRSVKVVQLRNASPAAIQSTLTSMLPRVRVSTTASRGGTSSSSSSSRPGSSSSSSSDQDAARRAFIERMRSGGGSPFGSSRSFGSSPFSRGSSGSPFSRGSSSFSRGSSGSPFSRGRGR